MATILSAAGEPHFRLVTPNSCLMVWKPAPVLV
jgi:ATP-dependent protease ClpP protease subunit